MEVFREQPIFIWQKDLVIIFIQNPKTQEKIWEEAMDYGIRQMVYSGQSLEKGKTYHLFWKEGNITSSPFPFKIIGGDRRKTIEAELQKLEKKADGASAEEMALLRADYFLKQGLLWDAFNEMLSVEEPSDELNETLKKIKKEEFCPIKKKKTEI